MRTFTVLSMCTSIAITGWAGSASHDVLSEHEAGNSSLSCVEIEVEMSRAQDVIDAVKRPRGFIRQGRVRWCFVVPV